MYTVSSVFLRIPYSLGVPDQTPNLGLFWYFFTETFEHFRVFFLCVFQINAFIYVLPLTIRFRCVIPDCPVCDVFVVVDTLITVML